MKKTITLTIAVLLTTLMTAQNRYDALRYSQNFYEGSAKSIAMGNAKLGLKEIADEVTDTHDEGGIYNSFKKHGLI